MNITTNEWIDAERNKPWRHRPVLARSVKGKLFVLKWNGMYWVNANTGTCIEPAGYNHHIHKITHFYIFEKYEDG